MREAALYLNTSFLYFVSWLEQRPEHTPVFIPTGSGHVFQLQRARPWGLTRSMWRMSAHLITAEPDETGAQELIADNVALVEFRIEALSTERVAVKVSWQEVADSYVELLLREMALAWPEGTAVAAQPYSPVPNVSQGTSARPRVVELSDAEEAAFATHGFKSSLPILVTGRTEKRATNILEVGDQEVPLDDADFVLFLQLVLALFQRPDGGGWVGFAALHFWSVDGSSRTGEVDHKIMQHLARLRKPFRNRFGVLRHTDLIQQKRSRMRLSTHPRYVDGDWAKLLSHSHDGVVVLAKKLIDRTASRNRSAGAA